jgi:hypothetical protein
MHPTQCRAEADEGLFYIIVFRELILMEGSPVNFALIPIPSLPLELVECIGNNTTRRSRKRAEGVTVHQGQRESMIHSLLLEVQIREGISARNAHTPLTIRLTSKPTLWWVNAFKNYVLMLIELVVLRIYYYYLDESHRRRVPLQTVCLFIHDDERSWDSCVEGARPEARARGA